MLPMSDLSAEAAGVAAVTASGVGDLHLQWAALATSNDSEAPPTVANGMVYDDDCSSAMCAWTTGGQLMWTDPEFVTYWAVSGAQGFAQIHEGGGVGLGSFNALTGAVRWKTVLPIGQLTGDPVVSGNLVYAADDQGGLWALDKSTGAIAWHDALTNVPTLSLPIADSGSLYLTVSGMPSALNAATGSTEWTAYDKVDGADYVATVHGGSVYVVSNNSFGGHNLEVLPQTGCGGSGICSPTTTERLGSRGVQVAFFKNHEFLASSLGIKVINTATGKSWSTSPGGWLQSLPGINGTSMLVVAGGVLKAYGIDGCGDATCPPLWKSTFEYEPQVLTPFPPVVADGAVYVQGMTTTGTAIYQWSANPSPTTIPPSAPTNVSVGGNWNSFDVTWQAAATSGTFPIIGYLVKGSQGAEVYSKAQEAHVSAAPQTLESFTVQSVTAAGLGPASPPSPVVPDIEAPPPPTDLKAVSGSPGTVTLTWTNPVTNQFDPITSFEWSAQAPGTAGLSSGFTMLHPMTSIVLSGFESGKTYTIQMQSQNFAAIGPDSIASNAVTVQ
jgi:hypothetical protein